MTLHLVTAAQEEDHISSSDDARLYEAFVGSGGIVFSQGNKMSASMTDPNTMRIMDGVALLCGRYWNITNYEEVTITNGTPGMNSIALVVANIKTDPSEAVTLKVYEGVETEGEPVMPSYIEGDLNGGDTEAEMPLYAVTKTGLSVGDPMPQFEVFLSEKKFRDSISHVLFESATGTYDNTITLNDNISNYKRIKVFYGADTTGDKIVNADCCEFLPIASTFVLNAITFIGNEGGSSIKTKRFSVAENSFTANSSGSGIAFTQTNYREQGTQFIKIYKVVGYTV